MFSQLFGHTEGKPFPVESSPIILDVTFHFENISLQIFHKIKIERTKLILVFSANIFKH